MGMLKNSDCPQCNEWIGQCQCNGADYPYSYEPNEVYLMEESHQPQV